MIRFNIRIASQSIGFVDPQTGKKRHPRLTESAAAPGAASARYGQHNGTRVFSVCCPFCAALISRRPFSAGCRLPAREPLVFGFTRARTVGERRQVRTNRQSQYAMITLLRVRCLRVKHLLRFFPRKWRLPAARSGAGTWQ